jgi:hypothetical protein
MKRGSWEKSSDKALRHKMVTWIETTSLLRPRKSSRRTSLTIFNPQLTPPHLSSCSHNRSEPRYAPSPASGLTKLTITALLDRPCRETASYQHSSQAHFHHSYCYSSRFVRPHAVSVTSALPVPRLPNLHHVCWAFILLPRSPRS